MKCRYFVCIASILLSLALVSEVYCNVREINRLMKLVVAVSTNDSASRSRMTRATDNADISGPLFLLHIGPGKTGTTSIQSTAAEHEEILRTKYNMHFLGNDGSRPEWNLHDLFRTCYDMKNSKECSERWKQFEDSVNYHFLRGHNVFVSEEMITGYPSNEVEQAQLWKHLDPLLKRWRVRIIFTYRHLHEWVPSKYYQGFSPTAKQNREKREEWVGNGVAGRAIPPFHKYFDHLLSKESFTFPHSIHKRWSRHFDDIQVFNMHQDGDLVEQFFCQMIPEAPLLCKHLGLEDPSSSSSSKQLNPSSSKVLHYDMLAVYAHQNGWISDKTLTRKQVTQAVADFSEQKLGYTKLLDFPSVCLSKDQINHLFEASRAFEESLVPGFSETAKGTKDDLMLAFEREMDKGRFCSIDPKATLEDKKWQKFFRNLKSTKDSKQKENTGAKAKKKEPKASEKDKP